jgi:hypothetical protein
MKRNSIELRREFGRKEKRSIHNPKSPQRGHVHRPSLINQKQKIKRALTIWQTQPIVPTGRISVKAQMVLYPITCPRVVSIETPEAGKATTTTLGTTRSRRLPAADPVLGNRNIAPSSAAFSSCTPIGAARASHRRQNINLAGVPGQRTASHASRCLRPEMWNRWKRRPMAVPG